MSRNPTSVLGGVFRTPTTLEMPWCWQSTEAMMLIHLVLSPVHWQAGSMVRAEYQIAGTTISMLLRCSGIWQVISMTCAGARLREQVPPEATCDKKIVAQIQNWAEQAVSSVISKPSPNILNLRQSSKNWNFYTDL